MKYFSTGLIIFFTTLIVQGVLSFLRRPRKGEKGKVVLPPFLAIIGIIGSVPFIVAAAYTAFAVKSIWATVFFLAFSMLGLSLVVAYTNCRITYDDEGFTHKSFFGITRHYKYEDITAVKHGTHEDFIYIGKRRLMVDELAIGADDFFSTANKQYRKKFGIDIPEQPRKKLFFSPDIPNQGALLFAWIFMEVLGLLFAGLLIFVMITSPPENTTEIVKSLIMIVLSIAVPTTYVLIAIHMARFPERYKEKTIQTWVSKDYRRASFDNNSRKRH